MSITLSAILAIIFVFMQGLFSASEMSIVSQNRLRLHHLAQRKDRKARLILDYLSKPQRFLATTLVGVNVSTVISATFANITIYRFIIQNAPHLERYIPLISTLLIFPLIVIFGEIVPNSVSRLNNYLLARLFIRPLHCMSWILFPFVVSLSTISGWIANIFGAKSHSRNPFVSREELRLLFRGEGSQTSLRLGERKMIHEIFDLQNTYAEDIMTPLIDIKAAPDTATVDDLVELITKTGFSHIPIYHNRIDDIVGVVHVFDLVNITYGTMPVRGLMKKPYIIPETKPVSEILLEFRQNGKYVAFPVDEYGGVTGLLSMEDIIEEIVGEIADEHDKPSAVKMSVKDNKTVIDGAMSIDEFNDTFGTSLECEDAETIGGLIITTAGKIPKRGDRFKFGSYEFEIIDATDRRVSKVTIKSLTSPER